MNHWKLTLSYDGGPFHGWQVQPGLRNVQGELANAIRQVTGETVLPQGSGRTDAGVHALGQVASLALAAPIPAANLLRALNRVLPASIRVLQASPADESFHARHSARGKTYEYRIFERRTTVDGLPTEHTCSPFLAPFVWDCRWPLALEPMREAAPHFCGTHDFTSFAASDPERGTREIGEDEASLRRWLQPPRNPPESHGALAPEVRPKATLFDPRATAERGGGVNPTKTIHSATWQHRDGLLIFTIRGSGFLHHMVRNIVGTLVDVGRGSLAASDIPAILAARDRTAAGPTAPAQGLFLREVDYDPQPAPGVPA